MDNYEVVGRIAEGSYGIVLKGHHKISHKEVALKKVMLSQSDDISLVIIREIKSLQYLQHENVIELLEVFPHGSGVALVFEYMPTDLSCLLHDHENPLTEAQIKAYFQMLLHGISYCHESGIMHRDLKPANLLISYNGILKIADFGLACLMKREGAHYSHQVATRWYRAPELLYGATQYDRGVDLWAVGCIFGEMLTKFPLFNGQNDIEQLCLVLKALGVPSESEWPELATLPDYNKISFPDYSPVLWEELIPDVDPHALDLIQKFLIYPPNKRIISAEALCHLYFFTEPLPCCKHQLPHQTDSKHGFSTSICTKDLRDSSLFEESDDLCQLDQGNLAS